MSRLGEIEERLSNATKGDWEVVSTLNQDGRGWTYGVALHQDFEVDVCELPHTPQGAEDAELIAHAPTDLAALVKFAGEVEALHVRRVDREGAGCRECGMIWPCPTAVAVQRLGGAS